MFERGSRLWSVSSSRDTVRRSRDARPVIQVKALTSDNLYLVARPFSCRALVIQKCMVSMVLQVPTVSFQVAPNPCRNPCRNKNCPEPLQEPLCGPGLLRTLAGEGLSVLDCSEPLSKPLQEPLPRSLACRAFAHLQICLVQRKGSEQSRGWQLPLLKLRETRRPDSRSRKPRCCEAQLPVHHADQKHKGCRGPCSSGVPWQLPPSGDTVCRRGSSADVFRTLRPTRRFVERPKDGEWKCGDASRQHRMGIERTREVPGYAPRHLDRVNARSNTCRRT